MQLLPFAYAIWRENREREVERPGVWARGSSPANGRSLQPEPYLERIFPLSERRRMFGGVLMRLLASSGALVLMAVVAWPPVAAGQGSAAEAKANVLIERQGYFYVGGQYDDSTNPTFISGQMYVEYQIPAKSRQLEGASPKYPIIFV